MQYPLSVRKRRQGHRKVKYSIKNPMEQLQSNSPSSGQQLAQKSQIFKKLRKQWTISKIRSKFKNLTVRSYHQKNQPFMQEWQNMNDQGIEVVQNPRFLLKSSSQLVFLLNFIVIVSYCIMAWLCSVSAVYRVKEQWSHYILYPWITIFLMDIVLTLSTAQKIMHTRVIIAKRYLVNQAYLDFFTLVFIIVSLLPIEGDWLLAVQILEVLVLMVKVRRKIRNIRPFLDMRKELVLVESFLFLILIAHIFALVLYLSSKFEPDNNWLLLQSIYSKPWYTQYVYSLYWAITTIVTVGYGDITPQNQYEIMVVIVIEMVGTAVFGYIINIIGLTMSEMKKEGESRQEEIGIANRLVKCLSLNQDLAYRLRTFLKDNQKADASFTLKDERKILDKLKPALRNQILQQTNTKIIKKCLFFLTNFSKAFQDHVALKLIKRILQPNEIIVCRAGSKASLYIVGQGTVQIQYMVNYYQKTISKKIRLINRYRNQQTITSNVYGFTSIILDRKVRLRALSKQFTVAYELTKEDFEEALGEHPCDFEVACELRDVLQSIEIPESYEGPALVDPTLHYVPIKNIVIKKYLQENTQRRREFLQRSSLGRFHALANVTFRPDLLDSVPSSRNARRISSKIYDKGMISVFRNYLDPDIIEQYQEELEFFETNKNYAKYFPNWNIGNVEKRYNALRSDPEQFLFRTGIMKKTLDLGFD